MYRLYRNSQIITNIFRDIFLNFIVDFCTVIGHQFLGEDEQAKISDDTICRLQYDFGSCNNYYPM